MPKKTQKTRKAPKKIAKSAPKAKAAPQAPLAKFIKGVWGDPDRMEKFASGRAGRESVLQDSILNAKHAELVRSGCVRQMLGALSGCAWENMTSTINAADMVDCGHAECASFMSALKPTKSDPQLA